MKLIGLMVLAAGIVAAQSAAQTPVGAPAGATGQCKDGTYSTSATRSGACRGHQGIKEWYAAEGTSKAAPSTKSAGSTTQASASQSANMPAKRSAAVPAGASSGPMPAGATGQCKDGTYSTAATKTGACRGHQGVKQWFAEATPPAPTTGAPTAASAPAPAARTAPAPMPAARPTPAPMPTPSAAPSSQPATPSSASGSRAERTQAPGGGPGMVWVNTPTNVYHCPGSQYYGTTKSGKYMTEADAKAAGARPDHNKPCTK